MPLSLGTCAVGPPLLALSSGLALVAAFPRFDLAPLAWIALVPLLLALKGRSLPAAFGLAFLAGIVFFAGTFQWMFVIEGFGWQEAVLLGAYLAPYLGLFGLALNFVSRRTGISPAFTAPCLWVPLEYLRSHADFMSLPWALLGHSQYRNLPLIQIASVTGVYGVSFLIVMVNAVVAEALHSRLPSRRRDEWVPRRPSLLVSATVAGLLLGTALVYGLATLSRPAQGKSLRVAVVQGNIPQRVRWERDLRQRNLDTHARLTREAARNGAASLIVWPETSVPGDLGSDPLLFQSLSALARETNSHLLVGSALRPKGGRQEPAGKRSFHNSAFLISPAGGAAGPYHKIRLVPFGEYLPHKGVLPWPSRYAARAGEFIPGSQYTLFPVHGTALGVVICWENIFPDLFRQFVKRGAAFMVNMTNEAWFGETAAPYQVLAITVFRAVENRVAVVRAANTGISGVIDPHGHILGTIRDGGRELFVEGTLTADLPLGAGRTLYTLYGDIFAYIIIGFAIVLLGLASWRSRHGHVAPTLTKDEHPRPSHTG